MPFHAGELLVFSRSGAYLGSLPKYNFESYPSYRINEIEDATFSIPRNDDTGVILTDVMLNTLLQRDNHVYLEWEDNAAPPWAGSIANVRLGNDGVSVWLHGGLGLMGKLDTRSKIQQTAGGSAALAQRLMASAQFRQASHGDIVVNLVIEGDTTVFGLFEYEGDVLSGLQLLADDTFGEMYVAPRLLAGPTLTYDLHWSGVIQIATGVVLHDGNGDETAQLAPGTQLELDGGDRITAARLKGATTTIADHLSYDCVRPLIKEFSPEAVWEDTTAGTNRARDAVNLSVTFGISPDTQLALAREVQTKYAEKFRSFLYAYHNRQGRPWLPGYDWSGPNGDQEKRLTARFFRSYQKLAMVGAATVVESAAANTTPAAGATEATVDPGVASFTEWKLIRTLTFPNVAGVTVDYRDTSQHIVADAVTGALSYLNADLTTLTTLLTVAAPGETLRGVATDPAESNIVWVLLTTGSVARVRSYSLDALTQLTSWEVATPNANDLVVDVVRNAAYIADSSSGSIAVRNLASGVAGTPIPSGLGSNPVGLHATGGSSGALYVIDVTGDVRILTKDGGFVGSLTTDPGASGIFANTQNNEVWVINGGIQVYGTAVVQAILTPPPPPAEGAVVGPAFPTVTHARFVHIVLTGDRAFPTATNRLLVVYSAGSWTTTTTNNLTGPDTVNKAWTTEEQVVGFSTTSFAIEADPAQVIEGEEGRLCDWNPIADGYGKLRSPIYRTTQGHTIHPTPGWFPADWDVPDSFWAQTQPGWPEGQAYLAQWVAKHNREASLQSIRYVNRGGVWGSTRRGGLMHVDLALQGGPSGIHVDVRVRSFSPNPKTGYMEAKAELLT